VAEILNSESDHANEGHTDAIVTLVRYPWRHRKLSTRNKPLISTMRGFPDRLRACRTKRRNSFKNASSTPRPTEKCLVADCARLFRNLNAYFSNERARKALKVSQACALRG